MRRRHFFSTVASALLVTLIPWRRKTVERLTVERQVMKVIVTEEMLDDDFDISPYLTDTKDWYLIGTRENHEFKWVEYTYRNRPVIHG